MKDLSNAITAVVEARSEQQRIDNFLLRECKGVPRSHIYRILRSGEVRVNSRRVDPTYRLHEGDRVRIPPIRMARRSSESRGPAPALELPVLFEDAALLAVDKPAGIAVHGGSGISFGVIERMRSARSALKFLELVHRLDRETSGVLLLAKKRSALTAMHAALREGRTGKTYLALVKGKWRGGERRVALALRKYLTVEGERRVSVNDAGLASLTVFRPMRRFAGATLLGAELHTGRTHQIRVHLAHIGYPIAGDDKYGDFEWNRELGRHGLKRMFLHAAELRFDHPLAGNPMALQSPLPEALESFLKTLAAA
jgi:23S rRNA pseudouridine955/2504/2580 synthase